MSIVDICAKEVSKCSVTFKLSCEPIFWGLDTRGGRNLIHTHTHTHTQTSTTVTLAAHVHQRLIMHVRELALLIQIHMHKLCTLPYIYCGYALERDKHVPIFWGLDARGGRKL